MRARYAWLTCLVLAGQAIAANSQVVFERFVGTGDPVPGAPGEVFLEVHSGQLAGQWVAARGYSSNEGGLYAWDGSQGFRVATRATELPGLPPGAELHIGNPVSYDVDASGAVAVVVSWSLVADPATGGAGVWVWENGKFETVVLTGETVSGSLLPFFAARRPVMQAGQLYFLASEGLSGGSSAIYRWIPESGVSLVVGDPGLQPSASIELSGGRLVFTAFEGPAPGEFGVWSTLPDGSDLRREFDPESQFPGAPPGTTFRLISAGRPALAGEPVHFLAEAAEVPTLQGLFKIARPDQIDAVLREDDLDPTTGLPHSGVFPPGLTGSAGSMAFMLRDPTQVSTLGRRLIVRDAAGAFHLIAAEGRDFEGLPVGLIEFMHGAMDGNRLAFNVLRPDDGAVWIADFGPGAPSTLEIPTLGTWAFGLFALALAVAASQALRRRPRAPP